MADIFEKLVLEKSRKCGGAFCIPPNPFYQLQMVHFRSGTGKIYEVYGHPYPTTAIRRPPFKRGDVDLKKWHWFNPLPYVPDTVVWSFRNNINYSQTACLTTALTIAVNRETVLKNYWTKTKNAISNAGKTAIGGGGTFTYPQAYVVPAKQKDMPDTIKMMNNLLENGIEVDRADTEFIIGGRVYPKGSFIISMVQPTSRLIYALFEPQKLVEGQSSPYDASAWQYGLMRDVEVDRIDEPAIFAVQKTRITADHIECPSVVSEETSEGAYVIDHNSINAIVSLVYGLDKLGYKCSAADEKFGVIDPGDVIVAAGQTGVFGAVSDLVRTHGLTMHSVKEVPVDKHELHPPRVALYHSWRVIQDGGWSRFTFEQFIPYTLIQRTDVLEGDLRKKYDVIFLPDAGASALKEGNPPGSYPEDVWYGPVQTTKRNGGLGDEGISQLKKFVDEGGVLICNNASSDLPIDYNLIAGVRIWKAREKNNFFSAPGPIVRIKPNRASRICYGADEAECVYQNQSPVFTAPEDWVVASYPETPEAIMLSGQLENPEKIAGKAAIVAAPAKDGTGHVVLFGTDITYRWQSHGAYFYLWNAILNWDALRR